MSPSTVPLTVGTPPPQVTMVLDTGSEPSWPHYKKTLNTLRFHIPTPLPYFDGVTYTVQLEGTKVYNALKNVFTRRTKGILRPFEGTVDLCYRVELNRTVLPPLPTVNLLFRGV
ncbi:unnamed protein product [Fraxinus pennsylvanica]|uniref:Peptidase A1 domain-containing protein n=1 Tax=Fraxinus pennsylvanica TaxID=56036 RepID=A0AAD1ZFJ0_9LAMI|nr:unnamed protein product [Fraxinus pennsylvanica]